VPFKDRSHAGQSLAKLSQLHELDNPVVIALPRGGVSVAIEIARSIGAPLDVMPVEDLCSPGNPEYVVGAVAENAIHVIDSEALAALGVTEDSLAVRVAEVTALIARLSKIYRANPGGALSVAQRPVVVVDDGSATAPALEAVALALSRRNVNSLWLATPAVPEAPVHGYDRMLTVERDADHADGIALIGVWYDDRSAPSDEVAAQMLHEFQAARPV
jgi:putative phosphoribosyl transferase